jgi:hypothetical protein
MSDEKKIKYEDPKLIPLNEPKRVEGQTVEPCQDGSVATDNCQSGVDAGGIVGSCKYGSIAGGNCQGGGTAQATAACTDGATATDSACDLGTGAANCATGAGV